MVCLAFDRLRGTQYQAFAEEVGEAFDRVVQGEDEEVRQSQVGDDVLRQELVDRRTL